MFTHLPEEMQHSWLKELSRIAKPKGYLLLTTHDVWGKYFEVLAVEEQGLQAYQDIVLLRKR